MDDNKRLTFTPDEDTMKALAKIKKTKFFDRPWSEVCQYVVKLGLEQEAKKGV